jgi:hypothetical protein
VSERTLEGATRGSQLLEYLSECARDSHACHTCGEPVGRVALVNLVYGFVACDCNAAPFQHLAGVVYHKACFTEGVSSLPAEEES